MQTNSLTPQVKHLVLIGGGHSHLFVLKQLGMKPVPGLAITLISRDIETPYSGSLPGTLSGFLTHDDMNIDLRPLAQFAKARLIRATVEDIDLDAKIIRLADRPEIHFDILSLNIGSQPDASTILGADEFACPVKPIDKFLTRWESVRAEAVQRVSSQKDYAITMVGGGPASVELALAMQYRIHTECKLALESESSLKLSIISSSSEILARHNTKVRRAALDTLRRRNIKVELGQRVTRFLADSVQTDLGGEYACDAAFYATGASLPKWPVRCGIAMSDDGFIDTLPTLQSASHDFVFAAGDAATIRGASRPKSGVYAVRAGIPLADNLVRFATGKRLKPFKPQKHALALISLGDKTAIASRETMSLQGKSAWILKQRIDKAFVTRFSQLPSMEAKLDLTKGLMDVEAEAELRRHAMRCAGCGAKVGGGLLGEVLDDLHGAVGTEKKPIEDASIIPLRDGRALLQSIDQISAFIDDPWLFARIATNHCLSDIYAMGETPHSALAVVGLPLASQRIMKHTLADLMRGCKHELDANDCELLGGHTAENPQLQLGLTVNAFAEANTSLAKHTLKQGDVLIITKPLGTGTLFAADMRSLSRNRWIESAIEQMLLSNKLAAQVFRKHGASACTDVTGFGLAGHLFEMLDPNRVEAELDLASLPAFDGSLDLLSAGVHSSLQPSNLRVAKGIHNHEGFGSDPRFQLLFDPQTSGGLLAALPEADAKDCLEDLIKAGHSGAAIIGRVIKIGASDSAIILK